MNVPFLGSIPLVQSVCEAGDAGRPAVYQENTPSSIAFDELTKNILKELENLKKSYFPYSKTEYETVRQNESLDYTGIWNIIDPIRFYNKNKPNNTFKSYIENNVDKIKVIKVIFIAYNYTNI
jgi:hypothetical protein